jgi:NADPH:quinone reductase-like Zn-dependent oxidoreductase
MRLRTKILSTIVVILAAAVAATQLAVGYDAPCQPPPSGPTGTPTMKAVLHRCYGSADVITIEDVAKPSPRDGQVLVKVRAASLNALDSHVLHGDPYLVMRFAGGIGSPKSPALGVDFAGTVEAVGKDVTDFKPGDEVFGGTGARFAAFAEYVTVYPAFATLARKPANVTFEQAAAVPVAALTALQALRDKGKLRAGQKVLINGASGGVGTFAVEIAKALGAEVTGVCSTHNVEMVRQIGADHVFDYTREDFTKSGERYDLIIDIVASRSLAEYRRVLEPDGTYVIVGAAGRGHWLGPLAPALKTLAYAPFASPDFAFFVANLNKPDLLFVTELMEQGKVRPVVDRTYPLKEIRDAFRYFDQGHARGKIVVTFD